MGVDIVEKNFKTINEQVEILKNKGLIIEDENVVKDTLLRENYFFLMGYRPTFNSYLFIVNIKISNIISIIQEVWIS